MPSISSLQHPTMYRKGFSTSSSTSSTSSTSRSSPRGSRIKKTMYEDEDQFLTKRNVRARIESPQPQEKSSVWLIVSHRSEMNNGDWNVTFTENSDQQIHGVYFNLQEANKRAIQILNNEIELTNGKLDISLKSRSDNTKKCALSRSNRCHHLSYYHEIEEYPDTASDTSSSDYDVSYDINKSDTTQSFDEKSLTPFCFNHGNFHIKVRNEAIKDI
mmetsp:Transcript_46411/g.59668  ORF Transcript_46411/g.59668 Transcript_46411/m.59668 type:complete len:216 (+) Transcript_46411:175-822(+)